MKSKIKVYIRCSLEKVEAFIENNTAAMMVGVVMSLLKGYKQLAQHSDTSQLIQPKQ